MTRSVDLLVIGAGPAGCVAAAEAAGMGHRVLLAETAPGPRDRVCGEFVSGEAIPLLERLQVLDRLERRRLPEIRMARFTAPDGPELEFELPGRNPAALGIRRRELDEALLGAASDRGVEVCRPARFRRALRDPAGRVIGAILETPGGREPVRSRLLLGADGRASRVARDLGLDVALRGPGRCAVKMHLEPEPGTAGLEHGVEIHLFRGGYVGMQPVGGGRINLSAVIDVELAREIGGGAGNILLQAARRSPAARARLDGARAASHPVSLFPLDHRRSRCEGPGFLLAGDAAAVVPPFAGDGISAALHSGRLAGLAADAALTQRSEHTDLHRWRRRSLGRARYVGRALEHLVHRPALAGPLFSLMGPAGARALARATRIGE